MVTMPMIAVQSFLKNTFVRTCLIFLFVALSAFSVAQIGFAQSGTGIAPGYKVLTGFGLPNTEDGGVASVLISGTTVYGTTYGVTDIYGTTTHAAVFKMNLDGSGYVVLHDFEGHGSDPSGLVLAGPTLVGVTYSGPTNDYGSVFKINLDGSGFATLHDFDTQSAAYPSDLAVSNGVVYGTTSNLDGTSGGVIFKVNLDGTGYAVVHTFDVASSEEGVSSSLIVSGSTLYGVRQFGGTGTYGTVFKVNTDGTGFTTLHNFSGPDGALPSLLVLSGSEIYGTTQGGGGTVSGSGIDGGNGVVFKIGTDGTGFTVLHGFPGSNSNGTVVTSFFLNGTTLYGSTQGGGVINRGSVFSISPDGTNFTDLYNFGTTSYSGMNPISLVSEGAVLYGASFTGGANGQATLFSLPISGSTNSWSANRLAVAPDGTMRIEWVRDDEAVTIWTVDQNGAFVGQSPVYGPYTDSNGTWRPSHLVVAKDGTLRLFWIRTDHAMGIWALDANGNITHIGPVYGPYSGVVDGFPTTWYPGSLAVTPDGFSHVLWSRDDGAAGVWALDANGTQTHVGPTYGPYYVSNVEGWYAVGLAVANDGTEQVAWYRSDNAAGIWTLDALGNKTRIGPVYGPYADAGGKWETSILRGGGDGTSRLLWTRDDGAMGLWSFSAADTASGIGPTYGPYHDAGGPWNAEDLSVAPDGTSRVLWTRGDRAAGVWTFGSNNLESVIGPVYGSY